MCQCKRNPKPKQDSVCVCVGWVTNVSVGTILFVVFSWSGQLHRFPMFLSDLSQSATEFVPVTLLA